MNKTAFGIFLLGLFLGSGPCLASCGPLLVSYVAGTGKSPRAGVLSYFLFSWTKILAYLILCLAIFFSGRLAIEMAWVNFSKYIFILGGLFIIALGIFIALGSRLEFQPWWKLRAKFIKNDRKSMLILGLITGLLPCAPLLAALSYIGLISASWPAALLYGLSFGIGTLFSPLMALTIFAGVIPGFFLRTNNLYRRIFNLICGLIIILLGLRLFWRVF